MIRRAHWGGLSLLLAPLGASALGLGDIELRSALNQPLDADIELVAATPEELADLRVSLADRDTFDRYGLDRPAFLSNLSFSVGRDASGDDVIRITSAEPIAEPFVTVLVEATWGRGRLLREYTVLLDPPVMLPREAANEPVQPATARTPQPTEPAAAIRRPAPEPAAPQPAPEAAPEPAPSAARPAAPVTSPRPVETAAEGASAHGPVQRGETLWGIAAQYRPAGVTMNQMMVAIFRANPDAFQGNMNLLQQGATLTLPSEATLGAITAGEATQEALRQTAAWQGGAESAQQQARLRLLPPEVESPPSAGADAGAATAPAEPAAPAEPESPAAEAGASAAAAAADAAAQPERVLSIEDEELSTLQQLGGAEATVAETAPPAETEAPAGADAMVEPGVDLEAEEIFADDAEPAAETPAAGAGAADTPAGAEAEEAPAPPPRAVSTQAVTSTAEPSLLSRVLGWLTTPLVWMIAGLVALIGAGAVYLRARQSEAEDMTGRWEALEDDAEEALDAETREATERLRARARVDETIVVEEQHTHELPAATQSADELFDIGEPDEAAAEDTAAASSARLPELDLDLDAGAGAETGEDADVEPPSPAPAASRPASPQGASDATLSSQTVINLDQADPIAEADFHMAYGLYDQAADLVSKALESDPDNRDLRLKLLEVYFVWGNREAFLDAARTLRSEIGDKPDSDWDNVVIMGKQICPDEPLFAGATAAAGSVDLDLAEDGESPALDLAFDDQSAAAMDLDLGGDEDVTLELDTSDDDADTGVGRAAGGATDAPLDIGEQTAAGLESAFLERPQDASAKTSPNLDIDAETQEAPTLETLGPDAPTMESPLLGDDGEDENEDTGVSSELPTVEQPGLADENAQTGERTAEIDLDDLGLDMDDLPQLSDSEPTGNRRSLLGVEDEDADVLSATGVTQVLSAGDDHEDTDEAGERTGTRDDDADEASDAAYAATDVMRAGDVAGDTGATASFQGIPGSDSSDDLDLDIDLDELSAALDGGDTVEQPGVARYGVDEASLDLDVGDAEGGNGAAETEQMGALEPQTLTEVGTKLDLARAYIDMGDPEGAKSILEEVLDEGDNSQKQEAQGLIEAL